MKHTIATILAIAALTVEAQEITLTLATPLVETNTVSEVVLTPTRDMVGIARPWLDHEGKWGRKIDDGSFHVVLTGYQVRGRMDTPLAQIKRAIEGEIEITNQQMRDAADVLEIDGSWAGGDPEFQTTILAAMRRVADIIGQSEEWAYAYYDALSAQIASQIGGAADALEVD